MPITNVWADIPGEPRIMRLESSDTLAAVQAEGYLSDETNWVETQNANMTWLDSDEVRVKASDGSAIFGIAIVGEDISLSAASQVGQTFTVEVPFTFSDLESAGQVVVLKAQSTTAQYIVRGIALSEAGTNFDGAGDRLVQMTDGTNDWTIVLAATLQALANGEWGSTEVPYPLNDGITKLSAAGADIVLEYNAGATDYIAGAGTMVVTLERAA